MSTLRVLLLMSVKTFRKKNQGPIVRRGGALFFYHVSLWRPFKRDVIKEYKICFVVVFRKTIFNFRINFSEKIQQEKKYTCIKKNLKIIHYRWHDVNYSIVFFLMS